MNNQMQITTEYLLAGSSEVSVPELKRLTRSADAAVRARVAENIVTPIGSLLRLLNDESGEVRLSLSHNKALPSIFLAQLAHDRDVDVRYGMAENPNLSASILRTLLTDENPYVADRAEQTLLRIAATETLVKSVA